MAKSKLVVFFALILLFSVPAGLVQASGHGENVKGTAVVSDGNTLGDLLTVTLEGVSLPAEGSYLVAWLISDDGSVKVNVGAITVALNGSANHTYVSSAGDNLLASYGGFAITVESAPDVSEPSMDIPLIGYLAGEENLGLARILVVESADDPASGSVAKLRSQVMAALSAAEKARAADSAADLNSYTQMVIDIIDADDGVLALAASASMTVAEYEGAGGVAAAVTNVSDWATEAKASAATAMSAPDLQVAKSVLSSVTGQLGSALNGVAVSGLGGANQAYVAAQGLATFSVETPRPPVIIEEEPPPPPPEPPVVGEPAIPMMAQMAMIAAIVLLVSGSAVVATQVIRGRRS
jgi:hypothetical protein